METSPYTIWLGENSLDACPLLWKSFMYHNWVNRGWKQIDRLLAQYNARLDQKRETVIFDKGEGYLAFLLTYGSMPDDAEWYRYLDAED